MNTCDKCGQEVIWVTCGPRRLPLDAKERVYRVKSSAGTPEVEQMTPVLGFPYSGGVDHRSVCKGVSRG